jgi:hypothetical protein
MSKFGTFGEYPKDSLVSAAKALLTAWRSLERYHDDLAHQPWARRADPRGRILSR